jgi:hypothetical protein
MTFGGHRTADGSAVSKCQTIAVILPFQVARRSVSIEPQRAFNSEKKNAGGSDAYSPLCHPLSVAPMFKRSS